MADIITGTTTGFVNNIADNTYASVSDIRRESAEHTNEIIKEGLKGDYATQKAISDTERAASTQIDMMEDVMISQFSTVARDTQDIRAQVVAQQQQMVAGFAGAAKDSEINALKTQVALAQQTTYLSDKIDAGNGKTQELINHLKYGDLNRGLIERNAELTEARYEGRHWRDRAEMSQFAAVNSQIQALHSQLSTQLATQGTVNFGSMSGNAGRNTSTNNVV